MSHKKFSKELFDENDNISKTIAVDFLESTGHYVLITPLNEQKEKYKEHDFEILLKSNNKLIKVEVEKKNVWYKSGTWQGFSTIDVAYRKNESKSDLFVMFNKNCDTLAITTMKNVLSSKTSYKKTIYTNNELFFNVDLDKFKFYYKNNNKWNPI
jgi:hypothetical protein